MAIYDIKCNTVVSGDKITVDNFNFDSVGEFTFDPEDVDNQECLPSGEIEGYFNLTKEQRLHMISVNSKQMMCANFHSRSGYEIKEAWVDENGVVCVHLYNGDWYHYYENGTWG